jgi:hypothetical protein
MAETVGEFRDSLAGDVLVEGDRENELARLCFNLLMDRRPAVIVRCIASLTRGPCSPILVYIYG